LDKGPGRVDSNQGLLGRAEILETVEGGVELEELADSNFGGTTLVSGV
jgi:hypothetical protein